ncbi:MAG: response regulator transcription factor [Candidatus Acidiferrales bacterium]|jgi:two-component system nitrate/nitrite response regulator NarL
MKRLRVLIADDHETVRKGVCAILTSREDIEVCAEARNGEEAVRLARELRPDIVLMDFTMPVMDGLQASQQILRTFPEIPILMLSTHRLDTLANAAREIGLRGYITKNESASSLLKAVDKAMRHEPFFVFA